MVFSDPWTPSLRMSPILRPVTSVIPIAIPERRTRQAKRSAPPDRRTVCRQHKLSARSNWSRDRPGHPTYSQKSLEQFADNVNSHPRSLGHGDPHKHPKYQTGRGKIPRSHWSAFQVTNHRTISRSRQA